MACVPALWRMRSGSPEVREWCLEICGRCLGVEGVSVQAGGNVEEEGEGEEDEERKEQGPCGIYCL